MAVTASVTLLNRLPVQVHVKVGYRLVLVDEAAVLWMALRHHVQKGCGFFFRSRDKQKVVSKSQ